MVIKSLLILLPVLLPAFAAEPEKKPVFVLLSGIMDDHVNIELTEERLRRTMQTLTKFKQDHPKSSISITLLFSGAMADVMAEKERTDLLGSTTRLRDAGLVSIGYRGNDEPTHSSRTRQESTTLGLPEDRFMSRYRADSLFLLAAKHPLSGRVNEKAGGGLSRVKEVLGDPTFVTGLTDDLGSDAEAVRVLERIGSRPVLSGQLERDPARGIHGYNGSVSMISKYLSPRPDCSPEVYWHGGHLRLSETSSPSVRIVYAYEGIETVKKLLEGLDRSRPHIIQVRVSDQRLHLTPGFSPGQLFPPLRYAYDHPDRPKLPPEALYDSKEADRRYAVEESVLDWIESNFFQANPGSRFVSPSELMRMAGSPDASRISAETAIEIATALLAQWQSNNLPPSFTSANGRYYSLAEAFSTLATLLSTWDSTGRKPEFVKPPYLHGPIEVLEEPGPNQGEVSAAAVAKACAQLSRILAVDQQKIVPSNTIPTWLTLPEVRVNAAQFLKLMAQAAIRSALDGTVPVRMSRMLSELTEIHPTSRPRTDLGGTWTLKPAPLSGLQ